MQGKSKHEARLLDIEGLKVIIGGKEVLKGVTLHLKPGETVALMGPNGSGKSTLAQAIMGHPDCIITDGSIRYQGADVSVLAPEERARQGIFLSFQHPVDIPGLKVKDYLREIRRSVHGNITPLAFRKLLDEKAQLLGIPPQLLSRNLNEGFSGGERKRMEILQLALLEPRLAVLDETDSGLDIDALKAIAEGIKRLKTHDMSILVITHYKRLLEHLPPDRVLILMDGKIVREGDATMVNRLEAEGYAWMRE